MNTIIHESTQRARKDYFCSACEWLFNEDICELGLTFSEYRAVIKARKTGYRILKGQIYLRCFVGDEVSKDTWVFRAIPEIHQICLKYKLYYEE